MHGNKVMLNVTICPCPKELRIYMKRGDTTETEARITGKNTPKCCYMLLLMLAQLVGVALSVLDYRSLP